MGWKSAVLVAVTVVVTGTGTLATLDPARNSTPDQQRQQRMQQDQGDLSDQQERVEENRRRSGDELGQSVYRDSIGSSEVRPHEDLPHIRFRLLP